MKKILLFISIITISLSSCNKNDDDGITGNPNIPNAVFDTQGLINTNLPQFNQLQFPGNYVVLNNNYGINGLVVYYAGGDQYSAFELSDPNHQLNSCSLLTVDGVFATCSCDDGNAYNIITGSPKQGTQGQYGLTRYFAEANGNIIRVYNN